eukprot:Skav204280  [mRNA]  locus=scaffold409:170715:179232:- [translate_table: standard]
MEPSRGGLPKHCTRPLRSRRGSQRLQASLPIDLRSHARPQPNERCCLPSWPLVAHVAEVLCSGHACVNRGFSCSHGHVGSVCNQRGSLHDRFFLPIDERGELREVSQHFSHFVPTFAWEITVLPQPKAPGTAAVPPKVTGKSASMTRSQVKSASFPWSFSTTGRDSRTGHFQPLQLQPQQSRSCTSPQATLMLFSGV